MIDLYVSKTAYYHESAYNLKGNKFDLIRFYNPAKYIEANRKR